MKYIEEYIPKLHIHQQYYHSQHDPRWKAAMDEEYQSLQKNATWELVSLLPGRKLVQCKRVYKKKVVSDVKT